MRLFAKTVFWHWRVKERKKIADFYSFIPTEKRVNPIKDIENFNKFLY
jgi:hypothetical protein